MTRFLVMLVFASGLVGTAFGLVSAADAHQPACHRWTSCPTETAAPDAVLAGQFLTIPEAKRQVRRRVRTQARENGDELTVFNIGRCRRGSRTRVACYYHFEAIDSEGDAFYCGGRMRVVEYSRGYVTRRSTAGVPDDSGRQRVQAVQVTL